MERIERCIIDRENVHQALVDLIERGKEYNLECGILPEDGHPPRIINSIAELERDVNGRPLNVIGAIVDITERKSSEEKFHQIVNNVLEGIWMWNEEGITTFVNDRMAMMLREPKENIIGTPIDHFMEKRIFHLLNAPIGTERDKLSNPQEIRLQGRDGTVIDCQMFLTSVQKNIGSRSSRIAFVRDISEKKKVEEQLLESQKMVEKILETSPYLITIYDFKKKRNIFANPEASKFFGYEGNRIPEVGPEHFFGEIFKEDLERVQKQMRKMSSMKDGEIILVEYRMMNASGELRWLRHYFMPFKRDKAGDVEQVLNTFIDITDVKESEKDLKIKGSAIESSMNGVCLADADGMITYVNDAFLDLWGYDEPSDVLGMDVREFWQNMEMSTNDMLELFESGGWKREQKMTRLDGSRFYAFISATLVRDENDTPLCLLTTFLDTTAQMEYRDALREVNRKLNILSSITRHDIINQLTILKGYLELMKRAGPFESKMAIMAKISSSLDIVEKQIIFTKDYEELGSSAPTWQSVGATIEEISSELNNGDVKFVNDAWGLEVLADPLLKKVFYNLAENSLRHGKKVTMFKVRTDVSEEWAHIYLEDDGVGVPEEDKAAIFEKGIGKNTGLGLFFTKEILGMTGMKIREIGEEGEGACFEISVPKGYFRVGE